MLFTFIRSANFTGLLSFTSLIPCASHVSNTLKLHKVMLTREYKLIFFLLI